jgi:hypothetical protein
MPFFTGPVDTLGMIPMRFGNYTVVFYGRGENLDGFRGLLDTPAEEAYERCA